MATNIVADVGSRNAPEASGATLAAASPYTPDDHEKAGMGLEVIRLVELGVSAHGNTATFEFSSGFLRSIDVNARTIWHTMFGVLAPPEWRRLCKHVAPRHRTSDGTVTVQNGPMSFWTCKQTPRGRPLSSSYFDVPAEPYAAGRLTGTEAARELILFLSQYERARKESVCDGLEGEIRHCLSAAFILAGTRASIDECSAAHAAGAFTELVSRYFFSAGARHANPAYLDEQVDRARRSVRWWAEHEEQTRKDKADRMRAVHAAKTAKRGNAASYSLATSEGAPSSGHTLQ